MPRYRMKDGNIVAMAVPKPPRANERLWAGVLEKSRSFLREWDKQQYLALNED